MRGSIPSVAYRASFPLYSFERDRQEDAEGVTMERFTAETVIRDALLAHPEAADVFESAGLPCAHCLASEMETIGDISDGHDEVSLEELLGRLNELVRAEED